MDGKAAIAEDGSREIPPLAAFEVEIAKVHAIETEIQQMPSVTVEGLLQINAQPLKQALIVYVSKWIYLYTHSLQQRVWLPHSRILCAQLRHLTRVSAPLQIAQHFLPTSCVPLSNACVPSLCPLAEANACLS